MAEPSSPKKAQLRKNWASAMARTNGGSREDTAVQKVVDPPATQAEPQKATETTEVDKPAPKGKPARLVQNNNMQPLQKANKDAKTYQKHVLFALVSAFLIKLVAGGKILPTK